ncbi:hypothetical protein BGW36DRAFT_429466 [Talaromyces proteolyticus]|uniref:Luciferase domain-containing protein n=1 Tax=Talaromyces proteolyticus TaxID=1131652 RepID=A0AAD4PZE0_9EURO|nr:uncharacterized protein BGW36DRAFT_429466 [Talaromyces proteolyticus]KAH8695594.1 hypothetical protein BGW36DRAFT_429466 [Talaromyces proteolyticus]
MVSNILIPAISICLLASIIPAYRDYQLFMSYGPGGVPHNALGWLRSRFIATPFGREMFDTREYQDKINAGETVTYIFPEEELSQRKGGTPQVGPHAIPQRQMSHLPDEDTKQKLREAFDMFAAKNANLVKMATSFYETHTDAMWLTEHGVPLSSRPPEALAVRGEVAHVHGTSDHSLHLLLSPADAKKVIDAGWGQRHAFSGAKLVAMVTRGKIALPGSYMLIYAPRNTKEIEIVMEIVKASLQYMSGGLDVRH